jgi:hypothetical protein
MTLREKFEDGYNDYKENAKYCEAIADENAIEFGKWLNNQVLTPGGTHHYLNGKALIPDLYVIYKNKKGL